jgi:hypothetical protein
MQDKLAKLNARIQQAIDAKLIAGGQAYVSEDDARVQMDLEHWRENGRPMTAVGRAEVAAEDAEIARILRKAVKLGFDEPYPCGNGDGSLGGIVVYDLGPAR